MTGTIVKRARKDAFTARQSYEAAVAAFVSENPGMTYAVLARELGISKTEICRLALKAKVTRKPAA